MWSLGAVRQAKSLACSALLLGLLALLSACNAQSIEVTPPNAGAAAGTSRQLTATAIYSGGVREDVTSEVTWSSSDSSTVAINGTGAAVAVTPGSVTITASVGSTKGSTTFTVTSAVLVAIEVTPAISSLPNGMSQQFAATGVFSDNSTQDLTQQVIWASSSPAVAAVSNAVGTGGLVSALSVGTTVIFATSGNISGSTQLPVSAAVLSSIQVTPASPTVPKGVSRQFTATGIFSDNSTQNLTTQVSWSSSNSAVATISNASGSQGLASLSAAGSTTISATSGNLSGSTGLTVTAATLVSIAVTPANPSIANGLTEPFTATGTYTDNSTQNLTTQVTWASSSTGVATISNAGGSQGLASAAAVGSTTISATNGSISGSTGLTVTSATLVSIAVTPANPSIADGLTEPFTATGTYTDNSTHNLTTQVTWSSASTGVASISNAAGSQGLASSSAVGSSTISAISGSISGSTGLTVTSATLISIAVTPANPSIANGLTEQFTATGTYTDNSTQNLSTQVTWASSNTGVATISNAGGSQGLASSAAVGSTTISAISGSISGSTGLTVTSATLISIAVTPANPSIANGLTEQFTATGTYTDNSTHNLTTQVTWASSNTGVVTISSAGGSQGLASAAAVGSTTISAASGSISGSTGLTVTPCAVGFTTCEAVTIDHTQVGTSDSSNFPMLLSGTYAFLATAANGGSVQNTVTQQGLTVPADAVFTSDSGCTTPLSWEVESYDSSTGAVNIWVQIPTLSHTLDTVIYLCVGNSSLTGFQGGPIGAAWDSDYQAVWHFPSDPTFSLSDSTSNGNNGTNYGAVAGTGIIDGAASFAGNAEYITALAPSLSAVTYELWLYITSLPPANFSDIAFSKGTSANPYPDFWIEIYPTAINTWFTASYAVGAVNAPSAGTWYSIVATDDGSQINVYCNGSLVQTISSSALTNNYATFYFGHAYDNSGGYGSGYLNGLLDEVRVSSVARSADWVTAEYNNQSSPSTFYSLTPE